MRSERLPLLPAHPLAMSSLLDLIDATDVFRFGRVEPALQAEASAKAEHMKLAGSLGVRICWR